MYLLIDNYDSFTYNLLHYLGELGAEIDVRRNDAITPAEALAMQPEGLVISPGPCDPDRAGVCLEMIKETAGKLPILGVCLGHQCIGQAFGGTVTRAPEPKHGKMSQISHAATDIFEGLPSPFTATRYHSLMVAEGDLPDGLTATAHSEDGVIQGLAHKSFPIYGVQFHPESIASENGHRLLQNFLNLTKTWRTAA